MNIVSHISTSTTYLDLPAEIIFGAKIDRKKRFELARVKEKKYQFEYGPREAARRYFAEYPDIPPRKFQDSYRQRLNDAKLVLQPGGWAHQLFTRLERPFFYTLSMQHLGLPISYANPEFAFYPLVVEHIKTSIVNHVPAPYAWKIETGKEGNTHVHLIAGPSKILEYLQDSQRMKPIKDSPKDRTRTVAYMLKPVARYTEANYGAYLEALEQKQTKTLPRLSGQIGLKRNFGGEE